MSKSKIKSILIRFFDNQGFVHKEFVLQGQTVNQNFVRKSLKDSGKGWHVCDQALQAFGYQDNAPCHTAVSINEFLAEKKHSCGSSAPLFAGSQSLDLFIFSLLKNHLKGCYFVTLDNIQKSVTDELKGIPAEAFQYCYEQWKQRLRHCVAAQGNYVERDNLDL